MLKTQHRGHVSLDTKLQFATALVKAANVLIPLLFGSGQEIAENLHRADLTVQERADHIAEWVRLTDRVQSAQIAPIESKRVDGRGHRKESGVNAVVRDLGIDRTEAQRSVKIASIPADARAAADDVGCAGNE